MGFHFLITFFWQRCHGKVLFVEVMIHIHTLKIGFFKNKQIRISQQCRLGAYVPYVSGNLNIKKIVIFCLKKMLVGRDAGKIIRIAGL
jgi:hypothetical protein